MRSICPRAASRWASRKYDWGFVTDPRPGLRGRQRVPAPRQDPRRLLLHERVVYIRGNRADYDGWAAMGFRRMGLGRRAALLPARRGQRARRERPPTASAGRWPCPRTGRATGPVKAFIEAGLEAGLPLTDDFNGLEQDGVGW